MKFTLALSAIVALASAAPLEKTAPLEARQLGSGTRNDLEDGDAGSCPGAILILARGSTETGNMVRLTRFLS
ncbi:hypothetical protein IMZ48_07930 [Candidatus Bathyarchaeota archaeon]|nr:hypothetical protein [Candidatus Bathyarchaeota archaeon]